MPPRPTEAITAALGDAWASMTFPMFRPLLDRCGSHDPDAPVARVARHDSTPAGMALAQLDPNVPSSASLLSLFVRPEYRNSGIATALLSDLESDLAQRGVRNVTGVYMSGKPSVPALERVLAKRGFDAPTRRRLAVQFRPEEPARAPWYRKARLLPGAEVFSWRDLPPADLDALRKSQARTSWIPPELEPWRVDRGCDPVASVGMRRRGEVVGWIIGHRMRPDLVAFTTSFMRQDLARRGAMFFLFVSALERLRGSGVDCSFVTDARFDAMMRFVERRVTPYVRYVGETMGVSKTLSPEIPGEARR